MKRKALSVLVSIALMLTLLPTAALAAQGPVTVTIFSTNDLHGSVEHSDSAIGLAQAAAMKASTPNALLADAGDATQGASFATISKGGDVIEVMNAAGYDVMAAGNHEFDYGTDVLLANAKGADFPILAANVMRSGKPLLETSCVKQAGGKKIGFVGLTTAATATSTNPSQLAGIEFMDEIQTAIAHIHALEDKTDAIVLICHMGENETAVDLTSKQLMTLMDGMDPEACDAVTAVIDGHSHQTYADEYEGTPIVQAGVNGTSMGRVDLVFSGDAVSAQGAVLTYDEAMAYELTDAGRTAAAKVEKTLAGIKEGQDAVLKQRLCETTAPLWGGYIYYDYVESRIVETAYGDFVTDAFVDSAETFAENNGLDLPVVAVENGGGIGQTMPMGTVTRGDVLNAFNHGNLVVALSVTPAQLYTALELGLTMSGQDDTGLLLRERVSGSFLQVSGFTYTYDPAGEAGAKVVEAALADGTKLSRDDTTTKLLLATNNYVATFDGFKDSEQLGELGGEDLIVEEYILAQTEKGALDYPMTQGRIQIAGDKSPEQYAVSIPVLSSADKTTPLAGEKVHLKVDGGAYAEMTTDGEGKLTVTGLAKGPHQFFLQEAAGQAVYVNNYSGSGLTTTREGYYRLAFLVEGSGTGPISRADAVSALWELAGKPEVMGCDFSDLVTGAAYNSAVDWAASCGVTSGYPDGTFRPGTPVTREQLAVMVFNYAKSQGMEAVTLEENLGPYSDAGQISSYARMAVNWAVGRGLLAGKDGTLAPQGQVTRAELTQVLAQYAKLG